MCMGCHLSGYGIPPTCNSFSSSTRNRNSGKSQTRCQASLEGCSRPPDKDSSVRPISDISLFRVFLGVLYCEYMMTLQEVYLKDMIPDVFLNLNTKNIPYHIFSWHFMTSSSYSDST